jgi:hypothetical protein
VLLANNALYFAIIEFNQSWSLAACLKVVGSSGKILMKRAWGGYLVE